MKSLRKSAEANRDTTTNLRVVADKFALIAPRLESALDVATRALQTATSFLEASQGAMRRQGMTSADGASTSRHQGPSSSTPSRERESASSTHRQREAAASLHQQGAGTARNNTEVFGYPSYFSTPSPTSRMAGLCGSRVFVNPQYDLSLGVNSTQNQGFSKVDIKRNYTLTKSGDFDLWFDKLVSELTTAGLLYVINQSAPGPATLNESLLFHNTNVVRDIIISRLDDHYHARVYDLRDPVAIIRKLREIRNSETNLNPTSVMTRLYGIRMNFRERFVDFCERFDKISRELSRCVDARPLTDEDKRAPFYQAASGCSHFLGIWIFHASK